jgi:hypothetical protein
MACLHNDPRNHQDSEPVKGWIKTICKKCGKWIGNRPVETGKRKRQPATIREAADVEIQLEGMDE